MNSRGIRLGRNVSNTHLPRPWNELRAHFALEASPFQGITSPSPNIRLGSLTFYRPTADFRSKRTEPDRNCGRSRDVYAFAERVARRLQECVDARGISGFLGRFVSERAPSGHDNDRSLRNAIASRAIR